MNVTSNLALQEIHNIVLFLHAAAAENSPNVLAVVDAVKNGGGAFLAQNLETKEEAGAVIAAAHYSSLLRLDIEALKNAQMWQPIESAPRDGTPIIVYTPNSRKQVKEAWWAIPYEGATDGYWSTPNCSAGRGYIILPESATHWTPLPPAPETAK